MEYILNNTPLRTSKSYGMNNFKIDLDIPEILEFKDYKINTKVELLENTEFTSKINLDAKTNCNLKIEVNKNQKLKENIALEFNILKNSLFSNVFIELGEYSESNIIIKFKGDKFNYSKIVLNAGKYSKAKIEIINLTSENAINLLSFENNVAENADIENIFVDLGGKTKISNFYSKLNGYKAKNELKNIYLGKKDQELDLNYHIELHGEKTVADMQIQGALTENAKKSFKGTIDFKQGSKESDGAENENCVMLSDECKSLSLPMLLCHEDDVSGEHSVSSGKIDESKLFYIMTKGFSKEEAKRLIVKANFNEIINELNDEESKEEIIKIIEEI